LDLTTDPSLASALAPVRRAHPCKICGADSPLHGVLDFNRNCEQRHGAPAPLAGIATWYHRCPRCFFLFCAQFDHWSGEMFRRHIYNDDYTKVDPEAEHTRAGSNAPGLAGFMQQQGLRRVLDYGGGNGALARLLAERGLDARSWDPLHDSAPPPEPGGFDLVSAFEVLEHSPTPRETCAHALSFLRPGGLFLVSTLTLDEAAARACDHWYIAPRNGHISIHSRASLQQLFASLGRDLHHFSDALHLAHPRRPAPPVAP
jgi:SAM-dependent methyltransferase